MSDNVVVTLNLQAGEVGDIVHWLYSDAIGPISVRVEISRAAALRMAAMPYTGGLRHVSEACRNLL